MVFAPVGTPSTFMEEIPILAPISLAAGTVTIDTRIDISVWDYVLVTLHMGVGDTALVLTGTVTADLTGGALTAPGAGAKTCTLGATDDGKSVSFELRSHGEFKYMSLALVGTGGSGSLQSIMVYGIGPRRSTDMTTAIGTAIASVDMS